MLKWLKRKQSCKDYLPVQCAWTYRNPMIVMMILWRRDSWKLWFNVMLRRGWPTSGTTAKSRGLFRNWDGRHFQEANRQLYEVMEADTYFKQQVELLYPGITKEVQPGRRGAFSRTAPTSEVTWHHEPNRSGIMQLVCELRNQRSWFPLASGRNSAKLW